jgi:hypothetical protein
VSPRADPFVVREPFVGRQRRRDDARRVEVPELRTLTPRPGRQLSFATLGAAARRPLHITGCGNARCPPSAE